MIRNTIGSQSLQVKRLTRCSTRVGFVGTTIAIIHYGTQEDPMGRDTMKGLRFLESPWTSLVLGMFGFAMLFMVNTCAESGGENAGDTLIGDGAGQVDVHYEIQPKEGAAYTPGEMPEDEAPFSELFEAALSFTPASLSYALPVALDEVGNLDAITETLNEAMGLSLELDEAARAQLAATGMVMIEGGTFDQFFHAYQAIGSAGFEEPPILITTDSLLHLYHLFFDQLLKVVEVDEFVAMLSAMMPAMVEASLGQALLFDEENGAQLKEAALRNAGFYAVASRLLLPSYAIPEALEEVVEAELELIAAHEGAARSPLFNQDCPDFCDPCDALSYRECTEAGYVCYCEDYSQYVPRGHYTLSEDLERYFLAMMWMGRVAFRIKVDIETQMAVLATDALKSISIEHQGETLAATEAWWRIYRVTAFFAGQADDLTFVDYDAAIAETFGEGFELTSLADAEVLAALRETLRELRAPKILSGFISAFQDVTEETQGWRFMGQRFAPDSYVLGQMVWNHIGPDLNFPDYTSTVDACFGGAEPSCETMDLQISNCICLGGLETGVHGICRLMPRGLDVMSVLGNDSADAVLEADERYCDFRERLDALKDEFTLYTPADWMQNAYWGWLHSLKPLFGPFGEGYPPYMQSPTWGLKELNTSLASWAELRHDTILYVKQSYTPGIESTSEPFKPVFSGFVEPIPEFYSRLAFLTRFTRDGLDRLEVLPDGVNDTMADMASLLDQLTTISVKELSGETISEEEKTLIRGIGDTFEQLITRLAAAVSVTSGEPQSEYDMLESSLVGDGFKTTIVADVHTDGNTKQALEEGSGKTDWLLVIQKTPEGALTASIGPVFTYYEFAQPMSNRLTDEAWRELLDSPEAPAKPAWLMKAYGK
jgi:Protein of unknown function (DUF3160)